MNRRIFSRGVSLFTFFAVVLIILVVYRFWFNNWGFIGGDWPYHFIEQLVKSSITNFWSETWGNGLGGNISITYPLNLYMNVTRSLFVNYLGISWTIISGFAWFWLFILLVCISSYKLTRFWLGVLLYSTNTYVLMIVSGGQMGIAMAYSVIPLTLYCIISHLQSFNNKLYLKDIVIKSIILALSASLLILFDFRISSIIFLITAIFFIFYFFIHNNIQFTKNSIKYLLLSGVFICLFNLYWLLPLLSSGINNSSIVLNSAFTSVQALHYFSFSKIYQSFSLLHPNWSENIFGKVYLMRWEFLFIPIIAFSGLILINTRKVTSYLPRRQAGEVRVTSKNLKDSGQARMTSIFYLAFSFVAIIGIFLAKGVNAPFGFVYQWLFEHIPGFIMFRDPTKFYVMIAIAYAYMIPYSLSITAKTIINKLRIKNYELRIGRTNILTKLEIIFSLLFIIYWLVLIRPAWMGHLGGTFKSHQVPNEYVQLKNFVYSQKSWFRTYWIPIRQRFGFFSDTNPAIDSVALLQAQNEHDVFNFIKQNGPKQLQRWGVKYVIVPIDSEGELFTKDYKYDSAQRDRLVASVSAIPWLTKNDQFKEIAVFELEDYEDKFWLEGNIDKLEINNAYDYSKITWEMVSPVKYVFSLDNTDMIATEKPNLMSTDTINFIFSESYDPKWRLSGNGVEMYSQKTYDGLNSFVLPNEPGTYELYYTPQKYVWIGLILSGITFVCAILFLLAIRITKNKHANDTNR